MGYIERADAGLGAATRDRGLRDGLNIRRHFAAEKKSPGRRHQERVLFAQLLAAAIGRRCPERAAGL